MQGRWKESEGKGGGCLIPRKKGEKEKTKTMCNFSSISLLSLVFLSFPLQYAVPLVLFGLIDPSLFLREIHRHGVESYLITPVPVES